MVMKKKCDEICERPKTSNMLMHQHFDVSIVKSYALAILRNITFLFETSQWREEATFCG